MSTPIFICFLCGHEGIRHVHRKACVDCVRAEQRQRWHDRKARSASGDEQVSIAAVGGWQASMASDHLRKAWPLQVTA